MKPFSTIAEIAELLHNKKISLQDVRSFFGARLRTHNDTLNAVIELYDDIPLPTESESKLHGIPGLIKDNICQKGKISSCGSNILKNHHAVYDATVVSRLHKAGAIIAGRANMDEFAMGSAGEFSAYGPTKNPWSLSHSPGGSSSGSAAAVAAGLVPWALGSDTGGSVRQPASFCNLVGLYPTYGLFSRSGLVAFTSSTDQVGPLTRTVYDNAIVASALGGHDPKDSTSISSPPKDYTKNLDGKLPANLRIGVIRDGLESDGVNPQVKTAFQEAIDHLESRGAKIKYLDLESIKYGISVYFVLSRAEAASNLSRFDGTLYGSRAPQSDNLYDMYVKTRNDGFGDEVKSRIMMGNYVLSAGHRDAFYTKANTVRRMIRANFDAAFDEVDVLVSPTTSTLPFELDGKVSDPLAHYMADYFTVPSNIAGLPALSLQAGFSAEGLPIGFQLIGPRLSEELLFQVGHAFQSSTDFHTKTPKGF